MSTALDQIVIETLEKQRCEREASEHNEARAAAARAYHAETGRTRVQIADDVERALVAAGVPPQEVKGLGVSHDSIRNMLAGRRR